MLDRRTSVLPTCPESFAQVLRRKVPAPQIFGFSGLKKSQRLLIAGIPGTGKSTFSGWLATNRGFLSVDMEHRGLEFHNLRDSWNGFFETGDPHGFLAALGAKKAPVVLDWGFPPNAACLARVRSLQEGGLTLIWFDGDWVASRALFKKDLRSFDRQVEAIGDNWQSLAPLVRNHIITTLSADGHRASSDLVWRQIEKLCDY